MLLVMCVLGILWLTELRVPSVARQADDRSLNLKVLPAPVPAPAAADTGETMVTEPAPSTVPFAITVEPDQSLQDISVQYLGGLRSSASASNPGAQSEADRSRPY